MWLGEKITGNRKTYGMIVIGGVRRDITPEIRTEIRGVLKTLEKELMVLKKAIIGDTAIHRRTKGVGHITTEEADLWSLRRAGGPGPRRRHRRPPRPSLRRLRRDEVRRAGRRFLRRLGHGGRPRPRDLRIHQDHPPGPGQDAGRRADPDRVPRGPAAAPARPVHGRGAARRVGPLRDHRRGEPARAVARSRPDLPQPAGRAADAAEQPVRRLPDHHRQHRPLLLLHRPGRGRRCPVGPPARLGPGGARRPLPRPAGGRR